MFFASDGVITFFDLHQQLLKQIFTYIQTNISNDFEQNF